MRFAERRTSLLKQLERPLVLFSGAALPRNYPANTFPFRADSNFLYFFSRPEPGSAAFFDPASGEVTLFLPERTLDDALWHGPQPSFEEEEARHGVASVERVESLEARVAQLAQGRQVDAVAVADAKATARARALTGQDLDFDTPSKVGAPRVLQAIAALRLHKDEAELAAIRRTGRVTQQAHLQAMKMSQPGVGEQQLAGVVEGIFALHGCTPAYGTILSVRGETLHTHAHGNTLQPGDIVLLDAGAEDVETGYCTDVTRCWPVGGPFSPEGRDVYEAVLAAQQWAIAQVKPKVRFKDLHLGCAAVLAQGLLDLGLLRGASASSLVEQGAHALFFPHGLGHQLGLDVHDLEAFGDLIHYPGRSRSAQFGTRFLRMDMDLEPGMTFTIEPGLYFVPAILRSPAFRAEFSQVVDFERAERFLAMNGGRGFGGVRIEDDVLCTPTGVEVLTQAIPRGRAEVEALAGTAGLQWGGT